MLVTQDSLDFFQPDGVAKTTSKSSKEKRHVDFDYSVCAFFDQQTDENNKMKDGQKYPQHEKQSCVNVIVSGASVKMQGKNVVSRRNSKSNRKTIKRSKSNTFKIQPPENDDFEKVGN